MDKKHCQGCYNDFYNNRENVNGRDCWSLPTAKIVWKRKVHINDRPPWKHPKRRVPSCYHQPQYVFTERES